MSQPSEFACPTPHRSLKRKISQFEGTDESVNLNIAESQDDIVHWLWNLPHAFDRRQTRSDSFLILPNRIMTDRRRGNQSNTILQRPANLHSRDFSSRPSSSAQSTRNNDVGIKRGDVTAPTYRDDVLRNHNVYIDSMGRLLDAPLTEFVNDHVKKSRGSPPMTDEQLGILQGQIAAAATADEDTTKDILSSLLPLSDAKGGRHGVAVGGNSNMNSYALPTNNEYDFVGISIPKPDRTYGYNRSVFSSIEESTQSIDPNVKCLARPTASNYWPFFAIEFKSQSRGGTLWVAENQNAGTGSLSVNALDTLFRYAEKTKRASYLDSIAFSCAIDAQIGTLWIHWLENGTSFNMSHIGTYPFTNREDIRRFRDAAKNIVDYGLDKRLPNVRKALGVLLPGSKRDAAFLPISPTSLQSSTQESPPQNLPSVMSRDIPFQDPFTQALHAPDLDNNQEQFNDESLTQSPFQQSQYDCTEVQHQAGYASSSKRRRN
ncbi:hypothetical protein MMC09_006426 [Bachmanniomyces sp. S44760]|nr:hypothetical protein [Bachmanniomyces sp. S44760]